MVVGTQSSLFSILLQKVITTSNSYVKLELENALEKLIESSGVFQTTTVIRPLSQMCQTLATINESQDGLDIVLDFVEESFSRFMKNPHSCADEAMLLDQDSMRNDTFSIVLVALAKQWLYAIKKEQNLKRIELVTKCLFDFILCLVQIGESAKALLALVGYLQDNATDAARGGLYELKNAIFGWLPERSDRLPGTQ